MSSSFQNMCRTCMVNESKQSKEEVNKSKVKKKTRMVSILSVPKDIKEEHSLMELLKTSAPQLKIEENDQLPKIVCLECSEKIKELYRFQQNCLSVEQKLYKMLEQQPNETFDDNVEDVDIFKTEFDDPFMEENSMESDEDLIVEDDIKMESVEKDEFTGNGSDLSIDFVWDDKSDSDWEDDLPLKSETKKAKKIKKELIDDETFKAFSNEDYNDEIKLTKTKSKPKPTKSKPTTTRKRTKGIPNDNQQLYPCDKCNRKLKTEWSLKKHQELHNENDNKDQLYNCNICNTVFEKKYDYYEHLRTHTGELSFLCTECGKGFASAGSLKQHSYRHLNQYMFTCSECPKSFPTKADLMGHINTHREIPKRHVCDVCGSRFKTPFLLKQHQRYHNNDKRFACEYCEKRFVTKDKCQRHTRIHTGEKPFKCSYCDKAYNQSNELKKHLNSHLGVNVYQCQFCPLRFPTVKIVREHFLTHKNDDEETRIRNLAELHAAELKGINIR